MRKAERLANALDMHWIEHHRCHPSDAPMCETDAAELRHSKGPTMKYKLPPLPCPFCGNEPKVVDDLITFHVECSVCGSTGAVSSYESGSIEVWNRRAAIEVQGVPDKTGTAYADLHAKWRKGRQELANLTRAHEKLKAQLASAQLAPQAEATYTASDVTAAHTEGYKLGMLQANVVQQAHGTTK